MRLLLVEDDPMIGEAVRDGLQMLKTLRARRDPVPVLAALPLLGALVWLLVGRGLAPLSRLAHAVAGRSPTSLEALPAAGLPLELRPLVGALNGLLGRLDAALTLQRRFAADAAHGRVALLVQRGDGRLFVPVPLA